MVDSSETFPIMCFWYEESDRFVNGYSLICGRVGNQCLKLNDEEHLEEYAHQGIADLRRRCKEGDNRILFQ